MSNFAILVGVGGTGCKCLESAVHVLAAGLMHCDCEFLFVDQDKSNQCTGRARRVASNYEALLAGLDGMHEGDTGASAFRTRLKVRGDILQPLPENSGTLQSAFSVARVPGRARKQFDDAWLMRAIYSEAERTDSMDNGFRARPAVGSAAYAASIAEAEDAKERGPGTGERDAMWSQLTSALDEALARNYQRIDIVLFGSIFGGTGAAGLPSLGRHLREYVAKFRSGQVHVAAILMLPYYDVNPPKDLSDAYGPVPSGQVRLALEHYTRLMSGPIPERPFDSAYLVGLSELIELRYDEQGGGGGQDNPPLAPELLGALGAAHLLASAPAMGAFYYCVREHGTRMTLRDLPAVSSEVPSPGAALVDLMRCGFAYLLAYYPIFWQVTRRKGSLDDYPFVRQHISRKQLEGGKDTFDRARVYFQDLLSWAAAIEAHYPGHKPSDPLFPARRVHIEFFAAKSFAEMEKPSPPTPELKYGMNGNGAGAPTMLDSHEIQLVKEAFKLLEVDARGLEMHKVLERLGTKSTNAPARRGPRRMIEVLYHASKLGAR